MTVDEHDAVDDPLLLLPELVFEIGGALPGIHSQIEGLYLKAGDGRVASAANFFAAEPGRVHTAYPAAT